MVVHRRLEEHLNGRPKSAAFLEQAHEVLQQYGYLNARYTEWENEVFARERINDSNLQFLEEVHDRWEWKTGYFLQIYDVHGLQSLDPMATYVKHAVNYWGDA